MVDLTLPPEALAARDRARAFVAEAVIPAEARALRPDGEPDWKVVEDLRAEARRRGLWTPHLPKEWGGLGLGPVGVAVVAEELGHSPLGPLACNVSAPDEGNMHALLDLGTPAQKERWLRPLAEGRIRSCFAMTEPDAGSDPGRIRASARREGDGWVLDGTKVFVTGAEGAAFAIVLAVTDPARMPRAGASLLVVEAGTPGYAVTRSIPTMGTHAPGGHCEVRLDGVRVPADHLLGTEGEGFAHAQHRLGFGRIGHAMRWIGMAQRALDLAAGRALERETFGKRLAERQLVQAMLAESAIDLKVSRLLVLDAVWRLERGLPHRQEIAMVKVFAANALHRVVDRALQIHGALGYSGDLPLERFYRDARAARIYDGPDEVHLAYVGKKVLKAALEAGTTRGAAGWFA